MRCSAAFLSHFSASCDHPGAHIGDSQTASSGKTQSTWARLSSNLIDESSYQDCEDRYHIARAASLHRDFMERLSNLSLRRSFQVLDYSRNWFHYIYVFWKISYFTKNFMGEKIRNSTPLNTGNLNGAHLSRASRIPSCVRSGSSSPDGVGENSWARVKSASPS